MNQSMSMNEGYHVDDSQTDSKQYVTFYLDNEEYGFPIHAVMEIRGWETPTFVPNLPSYVKGVINIRGQVVPILDLRDKLSLTPKSPDKLTVIVVLQLTAPDTDKSHLLGLIVDAVSGVQNISYPELSTATPDAEMMDEEHSSDLIKRLVISEDKILLLLDPNKLVDDELNKICKHS